MPVYFYHFRTRRGTLLIDDLGFTFTSGQAAIEEAVMAAAELGQPYSSLSTGGAFEVHDEGGSLVGRVPVAKH